MKYTLLEIYEDGRVVEAAGANTYEEILHYTRVYTQDIGRYGLVDMQIRVKEEQ